MKRVLIVGVSSFIGSHLVVRLRKSFRVFGTYYRHKPVLDGVLPFYLQIAPDLRSDQLVKSLKPDFLIYCVGIADNKLCEQDPMGTHFVNAEAPVILARIMQEIGGQFIFLSSAKVFSGVKGSYKEEESTSPLNIYGKSKEMAEELLDSLDNVISLRLGTPFGIGAHGQNSILNRLLLRLKSGQPTSYICDEQRSFYGVTDLANAIACVLEDQKDLRGLYHVSNSERHSYYDFATSVASCFGYCRKLVTPISGEQFSKDIGSTEKRGKDISLNGSLFQHKFHFKVDSMEDSIFRLKEALGRGAQ